MRISLKWLSEYVDLSGLAAEEVARRLTGVGLEVEALERPGQGLEGVVAARILSSERHPDAEKLSVTTVDRGDGAALQVVCGARNYQVGDVVPLAAVGTALPGGQRIEKARLRGVESSGMLCSAKELGVDADASGLLILPRDVRPGTPMAEALGLDDVILEVNVTPNRPDALSHLGMARELAAILGRPVRPPAPRLAESGAPASSLARVRIEAPEKCSRYAARVIEGVRIGPSPGWLARRLESCGVRPISNVVDATNYVLLELGHPLHAFDLDKVAGAEIVVRTARPGERIVTLDGKERALEPDDLLIADRDRGSALAGVMGGGDSEISAGTSRVLLESAWFQPSGIRRTSRRQGLQSEASYRFERGADPGMVIPALDRCAALLAELSGGTVRPGAIDVHPRPARAAEVRLRWSRPAEILGMEVPPEETRRVLEGLGFQVRRGDDQGATFTVPSWRVDVSLEEDLVEELIRARGYDAIPETLPRSANWTPAEPREALAAGRLRSALEAGGFREAVNFSFVAPGDLARVGAPAPLLLQNPISAEMSAMRTALVPSLLRNLSTNLRRGAEEARLYELARVYRARPEGAGDPPAEEELRLAAVLFGRRHPHGWTSPAEAEEGRARSRDPGIDFYDARAAVEAVGEALGLRLAFGPPAAPVPWLHPRSACAVSSPEGADLGFLGEIHPRVAAAFELPGRVMALELSAESLLASARLVPAHRPVSSFPAVTRDFAVEVDARVPAAAVERVVAAFAAAAPVEEWTLFDVYAGGELGRRGKKSVAVYLRYRAPDRTLTDAEVDELHARIVERLRTDPAVRGTLRA
ncbi:MAG TPA: phenylalanine--tRNA ligase subunit beta [Anaeromyxobacteraceae bacterium]|nr:phenylalanine--tRNA ligase subunit beta [Anaeromyxobacteraceae bacterium]